MITWSCWAGRSTTAGPTLAELPAIERSLPATATSIRVSEEDLLSVDRSDVLHALPGGTFEPVRLGDGVLAAWYP
jgi:hypothetical protein